MNDTIRKLKDRQALQKAAEEHDNQISRLDTRGLDFLPCGDWVLVELHDQSDKTDAGIVIPDQAKGSMLPRWRVLATGPGLIAPFSINGEPYKVPMRVAVGDDVCLALGQGDAVDIPGRDKKTHLVREGNIIAIVRERSQLQ